MPQAPAPTPRIRPAIPVRRMDFDFDASKVPADWFGGDIFESTFNTGLSLLFPEGERFFVESVRHYRERIEDPGLRAQIQGFAGQEAMHGKEHRAFNDMLEARGLTIGRKLDREVLWLLDLTRKVLSKRQQLAVTCGLEHLTAVMAEQMLGNEEMHNAIHPSVRPLWLWHSLEESEHKSVAFDVYEQVGGNYLERVGTMMLTTVFFIGMAARFHAKLLAAEGALWRPRILARGIWRQWVKPGLLRNLVPGYLRYFRPGFHPEQAEATQRLPEWRERLFGKTGIVQPSPPAA